MSAIAHMLSQTVKPLHRRIIHDTPEDKAEHRKQYWRNRHFELKNNPAYKKRRLEAVLRYNAKQREKLIECTSGNAQSCADKPRSNQDSNKRAQRANHKQTAAVTGCDGTRGGKEKNQGIAAQEKIGKQQKSSGAQP